MGDAATVLPVRLARDRLAEALLAAMHRLIARRIVAGPPDAGVGAAEAERLAATDPVLDDVIATAVSAAATLDTHWTDERRDGARADLVARRHEVREALSRLALADALVGDGPERVCLPGWGASTWRAVAAVRAARGAGISDPAWEAALARLPAADLGDALPDALRGLRSTPPLDAAARRLLALESERQDLRHALLTGAARLAQALDRGVQDAARVLGEDCEQLAARIRLLDGMAERLWDDGRRTAAGRRL